MGALKFDSRKILAAVLAVLVALAAVMLASGIFYLTTIQGLVRSTTTTNVTEISTAKAQYLDEKIQSDTECVVALASYVEHSKPAEAKIQMHDFLESHDAINGWIRWSDGEMWCTSDDDDLYPADREEELFGPALEGQAGSTDVFLGHLGKKRIIFYAPLRDDGDPERVVGAVYVSYPVESLQNTYGGTTYSDEGYSYVVDSAGDIVLSANRFLLLQSYTNFSRLLAESGNSKSDVDAFLRAIEERRSGNAILTFEGEQQFLCFTPLLTKPDWSFVTVLPLSMVERDGTEIVGLTARMVLIMVGAIVLALGAIAALVVYRNRRERESERYIQSIYQAIGANIDTAIFIVDRAERVVEAVFENIQDILGIPASKFFVMDPLDSNEAYAKVAAIVHSGTSERRRSWEFQCFNAALGRNMWLAMTSRVVELGGDEKIIYSLSDITHERDIRQRLMDTVAAAEEANRAKSNFLSSMSHDIRTPMNAILGFSTLLDRDADDPAAVREYNRKIATSGQHLLGLINDVLDMSKIESGKTTLASAVFRLSETVEAVEAMMRPQTNAKSQEFTVEVTGITYPTLLGDEGRVRQILMNVLSNAMKYTPEGGSILFRIDGSLKRHGTLQHLRIIVRDDGIGMAPEFVATIFDSFSREESSLTNKVQGTGLGMAITKNLVDLMGGTISVESEQGSGSTFIIDLDFPPADEGAEQTAATREEDAEEARGAEGALARKHFLVAEDNELNAEIIAAILGMHDATCELAENGREAVEKFAGAAPGTFDMIFMDVQMPEMNGHEATRAIRGLDRPDAASIPIIAMTANAFAEDEQAALEAGMDAHVAKPIDIKVLQRVVASLDGTQRSGASAKGA